jgi:hypothetical protein
MEGTTRVSLNYLEKMDMFYQQQEIEFTIPMMGNNPIDIFRLNKLVKRYGGHEKVSLFY